MPDLHAAFAPQLELSVTIQTTLFHWTTQLILDRIDRVLSLLEAPGGPSPSHGYLPNHQSSRNEPHFSSTHSQNFENFDRDAFDRLDIPVKTASVLSCESILNWPALDGVAPREEIKSFLLQSDDGADFFCDRGSSRTTLVSSGPGDSRPGRGNLPQGIQEEKILPLCKRFLALINLKNPVLDVAEFNRFSRDVVENGPGWDGPSCLVMLACALACLATPYESPQPANGNDESGQSDAGVDYGVLISHSKFNLTMPTFLLMNPLSSSRGAFSLLKNGFTGRFYTMFYASHLTIRQLKFYHSLRNVYNPAQIRSHLFFTTTVMGRPGSSREDLWPVLS
ncbi:hypothetical protein VF21_10094 [Pseudogymnoascus sp. 05NY08]|nr:hypothetical protein VF21_10094 [Pseudogymnoascus sp. 05NY08]